MIRVPLGQCIVRLPQGLSDYRKGKHSNLEPIVHIMSRGETICGIYKPEKRNGYIKAKQADEKLHLCEICRQGFTSLDRVDREIIRAMAITGFH